MGVQGEYSQNANAIKGGKICLRDFSDGAKKEAEDKLKNAGFQISFSIQHVDAIVVETVASSATETRAKQSGIPIMKLEEILQLADLQTVADLEVGDTKEVETSDAIEITDTYVRILDVQIPRRTEYGKAGKPTPVSTFSYLCLDKSFLIHARNVAAAAVYDIPCVLEGETATAKTTIIRWVASLAGQPVYRLNLNGQTDTSELVGRYVPASGHVEMDTQTLLDHIDEFDQGPEWARVQTDLHEIKNAQAKGEERDLNPVEKARLTKTLGLANKSWEFLEGYIPKALRHGAWVILDEMNLAEPQVLERLNSVLEAGHSLVLTEGDGTIFDKHGDVVPHEEFRLFGTMNPAEYAGRSALSPAFRDRWQLWRFVDQPTEADLHAMLRTLVFGEQPKFEYKGALYQAPATNPIYPEMQNIDGIDELLKRLATFHCSVASASGTTGNAQIGRTRRERYVFTRRGLLTIMKLIHRVVCKGETVGSAQVALSVLLEDLLTQAYVDRVQDPSDRAVIYSALRASGLIGV